MSSGDTAARIPAMTGHSVRVDLAHLAKLITAVREIAETVRTYGSHGGRTITFDTPTTLHVIAAQLESHMRSWAQTDHSIARFYSERQGGESIDFPQLRAVLSAVTPSPISSDVQVAELRTACTRLRAAITALHSAMVTQSTPTFAALLEAEAVNIGHLADTLTGIVKLLLMHFGATGLGKCGRE